MRNSIKKKISSFLFHLHLFIDSVILFIFLYKHILYYMSICSYLYSLSLKYPSLDAKMMEINPK